jgi:tRNA dimethylallyltransferase
LKTPLNPDPGLSLTPLVIILGPTAVGKTEIAIQLADRLNGEIVSADSRLFYRGMDIGTAKPSLAERARVPHHLIDIADPDQVWSLATFQKAARQAIAEIDARGRLPFLVGGTGQYVRAVTEGWNIPRVEPDLRLRSALESWARELGPEGFHARLAVLDPQAAASIDPRNVRRTVRALEVILSTGQRFSIQRQRGASPYRLLQLGLNRSRQDLYARLDERIQAMLDGGLVAEVRALLDHGYSPDLPPLSAIGYREIVAYLQDKISLEEAVVQMKRKTRLFVRRQANWFKADDPQIHWFQAGPEALEQMEMLIRAWLKR